MATNRRNKYEKWLEPDNLILLEGWARAGLTDEEIAKKIQINCDTLYTWKKKYPKIAEALKNGKELVDTLVENSLLRRALGYKTSEVRKKTEYGTVTEVTEITHDVPPDVTAQIFWLKNRRPDQWRDKRSNAKEQEEIALRVKKLQLEIDAQTGAGKDSTGVEEFLQATNPTEDDIKALFQDDSDDDVGINEEASADAEEE